MPVSASTSAVGVVIYCVLHGILRLDKGRDCVDANETALLDQARAAWDAEQWDVAAARYEELLALCPDEPESDVWWFDAALAFKFQRNWAKAFELGREAAARSEPGKGDPAFWNLAIAATIQGDWAVARQAWADYGLTIPAGDGEIEGDFGTACVRLVGPRPEVVWVRRICPTRARVLSIPFTDRRYGEIVVHDGAPNGERVVDGQRYPVFDELLLCKPSDNATFQVSVSCSEATDLEALSDMADAAGLAVESMSSMVMHRRSESEGRVEMVPDAAAAGDHALLLAAPDAAAAQEVLERWAADGQGRTWRDLREKLGSLDPGDPPDADGDSGDGHGQGHGHTHGEHGGNQGVEPHPEWPFEGGTFPSNLGVVAHRTLLTGAEPPSRVTHDHDGWWQALDAVSPIEPEHAVVACMMCLVELHPDLAELADLPPGWTAEREKPGAAWTRSEFEQEEE